MLGQETKTLNELTAALLLSEVIIYLFSLWRNGSTYKILTIISLWSQLMFELASGGTGFCDDHLGLQTSVKM